MNTAACGDDKRRAVVRKSDRFSGLDYLEVSDDHRTLRVFLLGKMPATPLLPENCRIEGGRRIRNIRVVGVFPQVFDDPELDDFIDVVVDRFGDFSTYTLRVVARAPGNTDKARWIPHPDFDRNYDSLDFSFTADCSTNLDLTPGLSANLPLFETASNQPEVPANPPLTFSHNKRRDSLT